jgi:hypothetical protein
VTTAFATRTRPFTSPYPIKQLKQDIVTLKKQRFLERDCRIAELIESAPSDNKDRMYWSMVYDLEEAPTVTGRQMILEYGIVPVPLQELSATADLHDEMWTIIEALAKCGVYLVNTNHLCDRDLYARLFYKILDEPCRMMPPAAEAAEFIDCLHPMDVEYPLGQQVTAFTGTDLPAPKKEDPYVRGPECNVIGKMCNRDAYLPKPW